MQPNPSRRRFLKQSAALAVAAPLVTRLEENALAAKEGQSPAPAPVPSSKASLPTGKIGKLTVSRLILGGNLLTHFTHSRDLHYVKTLAAHYNTDEKILETLAVAEAHGINTLTIHNPPQAISLLRRYRKERGGKIQWIICPTAPVVPDMIQYRQQVEELVKDGCEMIYLWGVHADALVAQGKIDLVAKAVALAKEFGVPSGVGSHSLEVVQACEQHGVNADFYIKTFHHHSYQTGPKPEQIKGPYSEFPGYWCADPKATAEFMRTVEKPWIAFKTMAAGAIPPKQAFRYAFRSGADFALAGMFDFEIAEDVKIAQESLAGLTDRERPWRA